MTPEPPYRTLPSTLTVLGRTGSCLSTGAWNFIRYLLRSVEQYSESSRSDGTGSETGPAGSTSTRDAACGER